MRVRDCSGWGVLSPCPLLVGAAKVGAGKRTRPYPCRREEGEHLCEGTGGLVPRRIQGSRREGDVSTGPEAHGICVVPCSSH